MLFVVVFFFFQAEDGIRDDLVTGVQTCALPIFTEAENRSGASRPRTTGAFTWKFAAKNVRDVAWAASPDYIWDASSWSGILAQAFYRPSAVDPWADAADQTRISIHDYSDRWYRYPCP